MSRFNQLTDKAKIMNDIQAIQININNIYDMLVGKFHLKKPRLITKIERQFYRRQILISMIKFSELIEKFEQEYSNPDDLPYLDFLVDYYLLISTEIDELNQHEIKIEKILGILNE